MPAASLTDLGSSAIIQGAPSLPQITVSGFFTLTNAIGGPKAGGDFYSARDVFSWTTRRARHQAGRRALVQQDHPGHAAQQLRRLTFNNSVTRNALADFLIGIPSAMTQDAPVTALWNSWYGAAFLQDDYRVGSRMTLNLGLRWDVQTPGTDPLNRFITYVPGQKSTVNPAAPTGQLFYGDPGMERGVITTGVEPHLAARRLRLGSVRRRQDRHPRRRRHVLRQHLRQRVEHDDQFPAVVHSPDVHQHQAATTNAAGVPQGASLSNPYNNFVGGAPFPYNGSYTNGGGIFGVSQDFEWAHAYQTNVGVQRQIGEVAGRRRGIHRDVQPQPAVPARRELSGGDAHRDHCRREHPVAPAQSGVRRGAAARLGSVLELQRPAGDVHTCGSGTTSASTASTRSARPCPACSCTTTPRRAGRRTTASWARTTAAPTPTSATSSARA